MRSNEAVGSLGTLCCGTSFFPLPLGPGSQGQTQLAKCWLKRLPLSSRSQNISKPLNLFTLLPGLPTHSCTLPFLTT